MRDMKRPVLERYLDSRAVPVVIDRKGKYFLVDRHHLCSACILIGIQKVKIMLMADFSYTKSDEEFWLQMQEKKYVLLQDAHGLPITPDMLPKTLEGLSNDPYRSLAGLVRDAGTIRKVNVPFSEFLWAAFFRQRIDEEVIDGMLHSNLKVAIRLAQSEDAKNIPGYIGKQTR